MLIFFNKQFSKQNMPLFTNKITTQIFGGGGWLTSAVKFKSNIKIKKLPENGEHKWNYFKIGQNNDRTGVPLPPPPYPPKIDL